MTERKRIYYFETETKKGLQRYSDIYYCETSAMIWYKNFKRKSKNFVKRDLIFKTVKRNEKIYN